jgi:hypothetical protein
MLYELEASLHIRLALELCAGARVLCLSWFHYFRFQLFHKGREHSVILKNVGVNTLCIIL